MNGTNVPNPAFSRLSEGLCDLSPEAQKAARYLMDNPNDVGVSSMREMARAAQVKPNTLVRLAQTLGFDGYEDFKKPFQDAIRKGPVGFTDRARWLQSIRQRGEMGTLLADMAASALNNIEATFAELNEAELKKAALSVWNSRQTFTLGVGVNAANAQNFSYLASTGMVNFHTIPNHLGTLIMNILKERCG